MDTKKPAKTGSPLDGKAARTVRLLSWFNFLGDFRLYAPVAILYYARIAGSYAAGMTVFSATMLASMVLELPTGVLSDWLGRKMTIVTGAALGVASVACYATASGVWLLMAGAVLEGAARAFFSGNNNALLFDSLREDGQEERFHDFMGTIGSYGQFALAVSALLGSLVAQDSFRLVMVLSVIPQAASLVLSLFIPGTAREERAAGTRAAGTAVLLARSPAERGSDPVRLFVRAVRRFFSNRRIVAVGGANMVSDAVGEACYQFSSAFVATLWPVWAIGIARTLSNFGAAVSFKVSGKLIDRFKELPLLIAARLYGRVAHIAAVVLPTPASPVIISSSSLFFGVSVVSGESVLQKEFSDDERATMGSIGSMGGSLLMAAFAPLLGLLADAVGPAKALLCAQLFMLAPLGVLWREASRGGRAAPRARTKARGQARPPRP
jgi:MFS family permease